MLQQFPSFAFHRKQLLKTLGMYTNLQEQTVVCVRFKMLVSVVVTRRFLEDSD